jgi:GNAT superfamily N-acetyltransferase
MILDIKVINAAQTYPVRHPELREGKPIESCAFEGDLLESTLHLGAYLNFELVGVASFMKQPTYFPTKKDASMVQHKNNTPSQPYEMQLRGMAVLKNHHKKGIGAAILSYGEQKLKELGYHGIWMNARIKAVGFYEKLGYDIHGDTFEIQGVGIHFKMSKKIHK